jgi:hypothetical protein
VARYHRRATIGGEMTTEPRDYSRTGGHSWVGTVTGESATFECGYCGTEVTSDIGWHAGHATGRTKIRICPQCNSPTFFSFEGAVYPAPGSAQGK